jgi:hypothetical protein
MQLKVLHQDTHFAARSVEACASSTGFGNLEIYGLIGIRELRYSGHTGRSLVEKSKLCVCAVEKQLGWTSGFEVVGNCKRLYGPHDGFVLVGDGCDGSNHDSYSFDDCENDSAIDEAWRTS